MTWRRVASIEDGQRARPWLAASVNDVDIVLARLDEAWYGVEDRCSHAGCAFSEDASLEAGLIVCQCHGSEFELRTGAVRRGPAERPVRSFPVRVVESGIEVDLEG